MIDIRLWRSELQNLDFAVASLASLFSPGSHEKSLAEYFRFGVRARIATIIESVDAAIEEAASRPRSK